MKNEDIKKIKKLLEAIDKRQKLKFRIEIKKRNFEAFSFLNEDENSELLKLAGFNL